jgi:predicted nuclease of predicted toxin-antitoxin system
VKLLLDEMWTPTIAVELRKRGLDVVAISEPALAARYAGVPDDQVFARAQEEGRMIVTDNVADFELARRDWESRGKPHHGIIYALDPPFNRDRGEAVIGQMVRALARFLDSPPAAEEPFNRPHFLRPATRRTA